METMQHTKEAMETAPPDHADNDNKSKDGSSTTEEYDPWDPPYPSCPPCPPDVYDLTVQLDIIDEWMDKKEATIAASRTTNIIIPDRTPKLVNAALYNTFGRLKPILKKDSTRRFLNLFGQHGHGMGWGFVITPEAFSQIILQNAVQCAKVALKGQAPELSGFRANPNYMTPHGYFPLHRATEMFSVEMIELLLRHGALANLRSEGGLLPLYVAVENTCRHKYLEDSLFCNQDHQDYSQADVNYIYKLIYLLCLPEMKIFLDTIRLLAKHTDNLFDELWNYIKDGKLAQTAVLLLAAQEQIRMGIPHKRNGKNGEPDCFLVITDRIAESIVSQTGFLLSHLETRQNIMEANIKIQYLTFWLVKVISRAGQALDSYIRAHPKVPYVMQVPHSEVLERVLLILKEHGYCPTGQVIDIGNLCPYEDVFADEDIPVKIERVFGTKAAIEMSFLHAAKEKGLTKAETRVWGLKYARRSFFPHWKSVLASQQSPVSMQTLDADRSAWNKSIGIGRIPQLNHQPRRLFGTAALTLFKLLNKAF